MRALPKGARFYPREPVFTLTGSSALVSWLEPLLLQLNFRIQVASVGLTDREALAKALGAPVDLEWHDAEVVSLESGQPTMVLRGTCLARATDLGGTTTHLSLSHDGGFATAIVILSR